MCDADSGVEQVTLQGGRDPIGGPRVVCRVDTDATGDLDQGQLGAGPETVERRIDDDELGLGACPFIVVAVIAVSEREADVTCVVVVRRTLTLSGMVEVTSGEAIEQAE